MAGDHLYDESVGVLYPTSCLECYSASSIAMKDKFTIVSILHAPLAVV